MDAPRLPGQWARRIADEALRMQVRAVLVGWEPAEALPGDLARECVVRTWHAAGMTDVDMARVSRWSVHTVRRLRDRHGLAPHGPAVDASTDASRDRRCLA